MKVDLRAQERLVQQPQMQIENAKSIGEQLSRDLELYADPGSAEQSPPFRSLARFWLGIIGIICAGAATLEVLGPPLRHDHAPGLAGTMLPELADPRVATVPDPPPPVAAVRPANRDPRSSEQPVDPAAAGSAPRQPGAVQDTLQASKPVALPAIPEPTMVSLPGGLFRVGSNDDYSERPVHTVLVAPFLMARSAVTVQQWQACVDAKACTLQPKGRPDQPLTNASWDDARQYAAWLSSTTGKRYRLPTEAEWEYAARAGTDTRYPWGNVMVPGKASCKGCGEPVSMQNPPAAEAYPPNSFGLFGMGGGVAEWVADCWHRDYADAPRVGANAWDAPDCRERVLRGGSWVADAKYVRPSSRDYYDASVRYPTHGLRVARTD